MKKFLLISFLIHGCVDYVSAQPIAGPDNPLNAIAPGEITKAGAISLDADTNGDFFEYNGDGDGVTGDTDLWPIPHGARVTMKMRDATEATCCIAINPDQATTTVIGAQSGNTTRFRVNGGSSDGACLELIGAGDSETIVINYFALKDSGMLPAGVCAAATANDASTRYAVYGVCAADGDCDGDGGHTASTLCIGDSAGETIDTVVDFVTKVPGVYIACRALGATDIDYWVTR